MGLLIKDQAVLPPFGPPPPGLVPPHLWPGQLEIQQRIFAEQLLRNIGLQQPGGPDKVANGMGAKVPPFVGYPPTIHPFGSRMPIPRPPNHILPGSTSPSFAQLMMRPMVTPALQPKPVPDGSGQNFRCIWCHERYATLAELADHLKEAKHGSASGLQLPAGDTRPFSPSPPIPGSKKANKRSNVYTSPKSSIISKDIPRKLVRGQDVWLGKGQEQTRQILKCMWCGASFKTLAELTQHMQETQHYTKVISQEQITSWKNQAAVQSNSGSSNSSSPTTTPPAKLATSAKAHPASKAMMTSHVSAVLSCKVSLFLPRDSFLV